jgi:hypothetical protein
MSFKIKRFSEKESYKITCDWIGDFADSLEKKANFVDRIKKRNSVEKFSTIEEKMNDIKSRVGYLDFDASKDQILKTESDKGLVSNASGCSKCSPCGCNSGDACGCNKCEACEAKKSKKEMLRSILVEMIKIIDGRKDINYPEEVLNECRKDQYMNFSNLESELDPEYLKGWLAEKIKARRSEMKKPEAIRPSYEEAHQFAIEDSVPSYYNAKGEL